MDRDERRDVDVDAVVVDAAGILLGLSSLNPSPTRLESPPFTGLRADVECLPPLRCLTCVKAV